jgi:hypothetical protein
MIMYVHPGPASKMPKNLFFLPLLFLFVTLPEGTFILKIGGKKPQHWRKQVFFLLAYLSCLEEAKSARIIQFQKEIVRCRCSE